MSIEELQTTISSIIKPGKGILAADESTPTITKRFHCLLEVSRGLAVRGPRGRFRTSLPQIGHRLAP